MKLTLLLPALVAGCFLLVGRADAAPVAVGNFSFETDGTGSNSYPNNGSPNPAATSTPGSGYYEQYAGAPSNNMSILGPDWSVTAQYAGGWNLIDVNPSDMSSYNNRFLTAGTSDGSKYAFINIDGSSATPFTATITSTTAGLNLSIVANTTYTLTVAIGNPTTSPATGYGNPAPSEFIRFLANGTVLNSTYFPLAFTNVSAAPNGTFTDYTATFTTGSTDVAGIFGKPLAIQLGGTATGPGTNATTGVGAFDNVRLDVSPVPEPSIWALMLGAVGLLFFVGSRRVRA